MEYISPLITVAGFFITALAIAATLRTQVGTLQNDVTELKGEVRKIGDVLIKVAVQQTRLDALDRRYEELSKAVFPAVWKAPTL